MMTTTFIITIGDYLFLAGIIDFKREKINKWIIIGIPLFDVLQTLFFLYIYPSYNILASINSFLIILCSAFGVYELLNLSNEKKYLSRVFLSNAVMLIIFKFLNFLNFLNIIFNPKLDLFEISNIAILLNVICTFLVITITFGFSTAINLQSVKKLKSEVEFKSKMFSTISHDLRSPVENMMYFINILKTESELSDDIKKNISIF